MKDKPRKWWPGAWILWGLTAVVAAVIAAFFLIKKPREDVGAVEEKPQPVSTQAVTLRTLPDVLVLPGRVGAFVLSDVGAETGGRVARMAVDRGQRVKAGDLLVQLDAGLWETGLKRAEIERREAHRELGRIEELRKTGAVSDSDFDAVHARLDLAEAAVAEYRTHVEKCASRSPVDGIVNDRFVEEGEYAMEGARLVQVVNIDRVKVVVDVPEREVSAVAEGNETPLRVAAFPDRVFTGRVSFVSVAGDRLSNAFRVEILVDNGGHDLKPGMIAEVSITRPRHEGVIAVPLSAVIPRKGEHIVFTVEGGRAALRVVRLRTLVGQEAVLEDGLRAGDELIVRGHRTIEDGMPVDIVPVSTE